MHAEINGGKCINVHSLLQNTWKNKAHFRMDGVEYLILKADFKVWL